MRKSSFSFITNIEGFYSRIWHISENKADSSGLVKGHVLNETNFLIALSQQRHANAFAANYAISLSIQI